MAAKSGWFGLEMGLYSLQQNSTEIDFYNPWKKPIEVVEERAWIASQSGGTKADLFSLWKKIIELKVGRKLETSTKFCRNRSVQSMEKDSESNGKKGYWGLPQNSTQIDSYNLWKKKVMEVMKELGLEPPHILGDSLHIGKSET